MKKILYEYNNKESLSSIWQIKAYLFNIAAILLNEIDNTKISQPERAERFKRINIVQPVLDYITYNYSSCIKLETAAALTHYEKKSFCRAFKAATGHTFHQYLNKYRISQACLMLSSEDYSIGQIGKLCGIEQAKTFSRLFRQHTGLTPSEYKKKTLYER